VALTNEPRDLELFRLHLTLAGEHMLRIVRKSLHPIVQLCRMNVQVLRGLRIRDTRSLISRAASSLNSRVNLRLSMTHLRSHKNT
jgi:hypothetical protein